MPKFAPVATLDTLPTKVATATRMTVCSAQPTNFAGIAAVALAEKALTAGNSNGVYTIGNGNGNGRRVNVAQQSALPITATGTANHIALDDGATLVYVTTCTAQALTSGGTVTVPTWGVEIADPT